MMNAISDLETARCFNEQIYRWTRRQVQASRKNKEPEMAARWAMASAEYAAGKGYYGPLRDPILEDELRAIGRDFVHSTMGKCPTHRSRPAILHVLSEAHETGGHTRLCQRWIDSDTVSAKHAVLITNQRTEVPQLLAKSMNNQNLDLVILDAELPLIQRAQLLSEYAHKHADIVMLHVHMEDPIPLMAFAKIGGPPVVILNHADHVFWLGVSIADFVINIRASGEYFTKKYRGISKSYVLPLPLRPPIKEIGDHGLLCNKIREDLEIPTSALVFLTIGTAYKFAAMPELNFVETAKAILEDLPNAHLIAIGPSMEDEWLVCGEAVDNRLHVIGPVTELAPYYTTADIYLEGFPVGSLTAMLDAGLASLPCVGAPETVPLPYRSDDVSFDHLLQPATVEEYIEEAKRLGKDPTARAIEGARLRARIMENHCGVGWNKHLRTMLDEIPRHHNVNELPGNLEVPEVADYWINFKNRCIKDYASKSIKSIYLKPDLHGVPLEGGIDSDLVGALQKLIRKPHISVKKLEIADLFWEEGYRVYQREDASRLWIIFYWFLRCKPTVRRFKAFLSLFWRLLLLKTRNYLHFPLWT